MPCYLTGQLLIAMPQMNDQRFRNTVILICEHDENHAMGVVVNKPKQNLTLDDIAEQAGISPPKFYGNDLVYEGGPVTPTKGIVIHSTDHHLSGTKNINDTVAFTKNVKMLTEITNGNGPQNFIVTLGHAGWSKAQLESEIHDNVWLTMPCEDRLIFDQPHDQIWESCFTHLGIKASALSAVAGHA